MVDQTRVRRLNEYQYKGGAVVYWMSRDQRVEDNWALLYAQELAKKHNAPLIVVFCLVEDFLGAQDKHFHWMLSGLAVVEKDLLKKGVPFWLLRGKPEREVVEFVKDKNIGAVVCDLSPLKVSRSWKEGVAAKTKVAVFEVDAHNVIPVWVTSSKQEYGAQTIRYKVHKFLPKYLVSIPRLEKHVSDSKADFVKNTWPNDLPTYDSPVSPIKKFLKEKLGKYDISRNDPNADGQSNMSAYLHFGRLSAQRLALETLKESGAKLGDLLGKKNLSNKGVSAAAFLEELIVRRELSENFCFYNDKYDQFEGLPDWAKKSLNKHKKDKREYVYSKKQFEEAVTHDQLWNAAQTQMMKDGKMHGYLRMYWAKKILEWSRTPVDAIATAIYLNDKYELDGRDPNGYVGILWAIGGLHDRPWSERPIFGQVRYMNLAGCKKKFDVDAYVKRYSKS
jgi:deoxyribodipyrimidine photo-lyase